MSVSSCGWLGVLAGELRRLTLSPQSLVVGDGEPPITPWPREADNEEVKQFIFFLARCKE